MKILKKILALLGIWFLLWPFTMGVTALMFAGTNPDEASDVSTGLILISVFGPLALCVFLTVMLFKGKRTNKSLYNTQYHRDQEPLNDTDNNNLQAIESASISNSDYSQEGLSFFERIFGPNQTTKIKLLAQRKQNAIRSEREAVVELVEMHRQALTDNWQNTVTADEYGTKNYAKWSEEVARFFNSMNYLPEHIHIEEAFEILTYEIEKQTELSERSNESLTVEQRADQLRLLGLVEKHKNALVRNWHKKVQHDDYGNKNLHDWHEEVEKFLTAVSFTPRTMSKDLAGVIVTTMVEDIVSGEDLTSVFDFEEILSAYDFEEKCAEELSRAGWSTKVTSGSGDQGIDVLAEKRGVRVVVQCKLYSKPVGNKAVQEAISGKAFEKADFCAVVAPNGFTRSAKELAERDNVFLLAPTDLKLLDRYIEI